MKFISAHYESALPSVAHILCAPSATCQPYSLTQVEPRDILDYGVIPELAGRIPVVVTLDSLTQVDLSDTSLNRVLVAYYSQLLTCILIHDDA